MGSPTDQLLADDSRDASHVPTRPAPSSRGFFTKGPHKASRQISLPPRNKFGFVTRTLKKSAKETSPVSPQTPSDDTSRKSRRRVVKEPRTVREEDPNHVSEVMTNDPLIERFEKLRLPLTASSSSSSRYRKDPSLPQTSHKTPDTAQQAQSSMEASKIKRPFLGERPRPDPQQRAQHNRGTAVIDESEDELIVLPKRRKANFSSTNFFQLAEQSRQSSDQRRSRAERLSQKKPAQRSRSPYSLDSSSDAIHTPGSSELSHEDLPLHVALFIQEEEDLLLAQRLQDEEVGLHAQGLTRARGAQHDGAATASSGRPSSKAKVYSKRVDSSRKRTVVSRGTIENPINLGSDVDEPRTAIPERARIQDYVALHGEPMNIDGMDQFRPRHAKRSHPTPKKNREPKQKVPKRSRDCVVCGDSVQIVDLPWLASCDHQPETCTDCYAGWISAQLQDSSWREVTCPGNGCKVKLSYHEIQSWASPETFQQYDTFIARAAFSDDPNFRWCRACNSGQIHLTGVEGNIFTCAACGHKVCIVHENTWHEGETCEEFEYRNSGRKERDQQAQEEASLQAIGKLTKKCPGPACTWNIEKNDGCDHMTCSKCRYEFCWICLCDYNKVRRIGNAAHVSTCKYHTSRLQER